ncbi:MAG: AraC family transcriptional regulator [Bacteroidota bacterium]
MFHLPYRFLDDTADLRYSVARGPAQLDGRTRGLALKFVLHGKENYVWGHQELSLHAGEFLLLQPEVAFRATAGNGRAEGICLDLLDAYTADFPELLYGLSLPVASAGLTLPEPTAFATDQHFFLAACRRELTAFQELATQIDLRLAGSGRKRSTLQAHFRCLLLVRNYLRRHPHRRPSLAKLARLAGLSPYHLQRLFTRAFGESPLAMGRRLRLERAQSLLKDTDASLTAIAADLGYSALEVFSREFRTVYGESPRRWRVARN